MNKVAKGISCNAYIDFMKQSCVDQVYSNALRSFLKVPQCLAAACIIYFAKSKLIPASMLQASSAFCYFGLMYLSMDLKNDLCSIAVVSLANLAHFFDLAASLLFWIITLECSPHSIR